MKINVGQDTHTIIQWSCNTLNVVRENIKIQIYYSKLVHDSVLMLSAIYSSIAFVSV